MKHEVTRIEGQLHSHSQRKLAIAVSRFNQSVSEALLKGALETLNRYGVPASNITVVWVPGAFELPLTCKTLAESKRFEAVLALGCVIQGSTPHFAYVCSQAASGISQASLRTGVPVVFGVLTTNTAEEAAERSGGKAGNKGADAAITALDMISVLEKVAELAAT
jgi:6,7-dimethyl-8-ribityllumazine synthase